MPTLTPAKKVAAKKTTKKVTKKATPIIEALGGAKKKVIARVKKVAVKKQAAPVKKRVVLLGGEALPPPALPKGLVEELAEQAKLAKPVPVPDAVVVAPELVADPYPYANIDWAVAKAKHAIEGFNPEGLKVLPRTEFLLGLEGNVFTERPLEDAIRNSQNYDATQAAKDVRQLAETYILLRGKQARLPKFGKWVGSLFPSNNDMQNIIAQRGQEAIAGSLTISCNPVDILRGADSKHFMSCLGHKGAFREVLPAVLTECPGIAVAFIDHADGQMRSRVWLHHAKKKDGTDVVVMAGSIYGRGFTPTALADYFADRGVELFHYNGGYYNEDNGMYAKSERVTFHECFKRPLHWDTYTWGDRASMDMPRVLPSGQSKKAAA